MGFYINPPDDWPHGPKGKKEYAKQLGAVECTLDEARVAVRSEDKAVLCWVDNSFFEALAYAYSPAELEYFMDPRDGRAKQLYIIDKNVAEREAH